MYIKKYYLYKIFQDLMPIYPLYLLLFESKGLTLQQISLLLSIWSLPVVLLEIPTGVLSDHWIRKNMIGLGSLLKAFCYFIWIFSDGFFLYAVGFVLWGISSALCSGSEEAFLYDSMKFHGEEPKYDVILGKGQFISGISTTFSALSGGLIGAYFGFKTALVISVITSLLSAFTAFSFTEINLYTQRNDDENEKKSTLKEAFRFLIGHGEIFLFTMLVILVIGLSGVLDEYDQLIAKGYGLSIKMIGIWVTIRYLLTAFGGYIAHGLNKWFQKITGKRDYFHNLCVLCLLAAVCLAMAGLIKNILVMTLYGLYYLIMSAGNVIQEDYIQQRIESEGRSTVHSIISLILNLYGILCFGVFGILLMFSGLHGVLVYTAIYMVAVIVLLLLLPMRRVARPKSIDS